jgi:8-oxo-dGTP pyrophosphatase MutT (NUDIX family)
MIWKPNVTVAAVVARDGKFLLVEEETDEGLAFNQPAGHLERGESLVAAVIRETREETAYDFHPTHLVGIYHWQHPSKDLTYLRFAFAGELRGFDPDRRLDTGIIAARWLSFDEVVAVQERHRSPLVRRCIDDLRAGRRYPLESLVHCG